MKKVTRLRQPEGGVDIFKNPSIPKKPRQPEGSGAPTIKTKKKIVQRQPETDSGKPVVKRKPSQPETDSGKLVKKKITGRGEFRDTDKSKKTNGNKTKKTKTSKPKVVTPKMIRDAGFTTLRDYLNFKQGKTRRDGKKPVRVGDKKTVTNVVKSKLKPKNLVKKKDVSDFAVNTKTKKKTNGSKKVASLKTSKIGVDGGASQVNKTKVNKTKVNKKKNNFFERFKSDFNKAVKETKRNFGPNRYKSVSTNKTNFNKKKKKLPKQIRV